MTTFYQRTLRGRLPAGLLASGEKMVAGAGSAVYRDRAMTKTFYLGKIVSTPAALEVLRAANVDPLSLIMRHTRQDWGDLSQADKFANEQALKHGGRILSAYILAGGEKVWVITEAESVNGDASSRMSTCLLLPGEY
jgi:hypothetical protein